MSAKRKKTTVIQTSQKFSRAIDERWHVFIVCLLCALGFLAYLNTLSSTFHFDDFQVIITNPAIRNLWDWPAIFSSFNTRSITGWTFAVNYALGQLDVFGYHFFNIWLHVCNAVLVYVLVSQLLNLDDQRKKFNPEARIWVALVSALIFLLHPIQTQAVNYIWQRAALLAAFFYLSALVFYIYSRTHGARGYYRFALLCCFFAMFSKEISFTLPIMVLGVEYLFLRRSMADKRSFLWLMPFLLMLLVIPITLQKTHEASLGIMRPHSMTRGVTNDVMPRQEYVLTQVNVVRTYLQLFFVPLGQNVDHDYPLVSQTDWWPWICSMVLLSIICFSGIYYIKREPFIALSIFWFFVTLSVECWVTSADLLVEHRMYLPMVGLSFGIAVLIHQIFFPKFKLAASMVVLSLLVVLGVLTVSRNQVWANDVTLWSDVILKSPHKVRAYNNRGAIYKKMGFFELALQDFNRALDINPKYAEAYYNRGNVHKAKGNFDAAVLDFSKVMELEPGNAQAYDARGYIYRRQEMFSEALDDFAKSIKLNPNNPEVFNNRAYIYQKQGNADEAISDYSRAIAADPGYVYAYNNRGNMYLEKREYERAVNDYTRAVNLKPDFGEPFVNRAVAYFRMGRFVQSQNDVKRAQELKINPNPEFIRQLNASSAK